MPHDRSRTGLSHYSAICCDLFGRAQIPNIQAVTAAQPDAPQAQQPKPARASAQREGSNLVAETGLHFGLDALKLFCLALGMLLLCAPGETQLPLRKLDRFPLRGYRDAARARGAAFCAFAGPVRLCRCTAQCRPFWCSQQASLHPLYNYKDAPLRQGVLVLSFLRQPPG